MREDGPGNLQLTMSKAFGPRAAVEEGILEDADMAFGLSPATLGSGKDFVLGQTAAQFAGLAGTEPVEVRKFFKVFAMLFAVEPAVCRDATKSAASLLLHESIAVLQPLGIAGRDFPAQVMVEDVADGQMRGLHRRAGMQKSKNCDFISFMHFSFCGFRSQRSVLKGRIARKIGNFFIRGWKIFPPKEIKSYTAQ